ncbi:hypothetical protein R3P38DRAFT_2660397 [Favolaschia claudopus]|uniref:Cryptic loci regulator 2 N-terminal domain-containing protein n=1 Tax=Favolaschia claudopus TaxID=2862362 RepID=A0AAV9ZQ16_9AGAR
MNDASKKAKSASKKTSATLQKRKERDPEDNWGGKRDGAGRPPKIPKILAQTPLPASSKSAKKTVSTKTSAPSGPKPAPIQESGSAAPVPAFFRPYSTRQPVPQKSTATQSFYFNISGSQTQTPSSEESVVVSTTTLQQLNNDLEFISEHDKHGDIAAGDKIIDESMFVNDTRIEPESPEDESRDSETVRNSVLDAYLRSVRSRVVKEIEGHGQPLCYLRGDLFDRPAHPIFVLHDGMKGYGLNPEAPYQRKVFVWMPHLLPGSPDLFKCHCGNILVRNGNRIGYNDDPIARRVCSPASDFFLLTNRWICNPRRGIPGCGTNFQGSDR